MERVTSESSVYVELDLDGTGTPIDNKCTKCHVPTDAMGAIAVPAGDLDLTDGPSEEPQLDVVQPETSGAG